MTKYADLSTVAASRVDELADALIEIGHRKAALEALVTASKASAAEADAKRRTLVSGLASGLHSPSEMSAAVAAKGEANAHLAMLAESLAELADEEAKTREFWQRCVRLKSEAEKGELARKAHAAAVDLDSASLVFNAAFEKWRDAKQAAHEFVIEYANGNGGGWAGPAFRNAGAGWEGSAALHPQIRSDLASAFFQNAYCSVANPRLG